MMELVEDKVVNHDHIATEQQLEDTYSKVLDDEKFEKSRGYLFNVPTIPFDYVNKNVEVTETSIASVNGLNPSETTSIMHVELCTETRVEPNAETSRNPAYKPIILVNPSFQKTLQKSIFVTVIVDDVVNEPPKLIFDNLTDSVVEPDVEPSHVQIESVAEPSSEKTVVLYEPSRTPISPVIKTVVESTIVTPHIPFEFNVIPDVETSQNQPVSVVETSSEIPQTNVDMVLRVLNLMWLKINLIELLNVVEEIDPGDLPLDQAIAQNVIMLKRVMFRCDYYYCVEDDVLDIMSPDRKKVGMLMSLLPS
ncbi:hypothetical protein A2U01_0009951 [Trifolium medium]|uniref:Uncharacterized protein n=1 Tax=Trifolium medium TaxID=97028 RepID=A0A392MQV5_9FABA|nr:hypothetical protein [Trifolium medium]